MNRPRTFTRRELVAAGTVLASAAYVPAAWGRLTATTPQIGPGRFADGVASGEPGPDAMTFWSRLTTERPRSGARLIVAEDEGLTRTVAQTVVPTSRAVDGALKARVDGLQPGRFYFYAWQSGDEVSPVGRTKTAPAPGSDVPIKLAFSSCQNWPVGFFNGHREAAAAPDLDLYLFLGDYTYEYGPSTGDVPGRDDPAPSVDLASYRAKLNLYRSDPALRELHRLHPCVHIWDDHEVADNYSDNDPRPSDLQRTAGYQASFEWLPRMVLPEERYRIYRPYVLGRQAEVIMLDQRQYRTGDRDNSPRRLLGRTQMDFLKQRLEASQARWKIIGNQVMVARLGIPGRGVNEDQWDGYPEDREELLAHIAGKGIANTVFVTGDIHTYMANQVLRNNGDSGPSIATEFIGGSITSSGLPSGEGATEAVVRGGNPWIKTFNGDVHGYAKLDLTAEKAAVEYRVSDITAKDAESRTFTAYEQPAGANDFRQTAGETNPVGAVPGAPRPAALRSDNAPNAALAKRRRRYEREVARQQRRADRGAR